MNLLFEWKWQLTLFNKFKSKKKYFCEKYIKKKKTLNIKIPNNWCMLWLSEMHKKEKNNSFLKFVFLKIYTDTLATLTLV